ncbi:MAG: HepT-like ribonuclease domain-containing protein [Armatimonadota bacterium]
MPPEDILLRIQHMLSVAEEVLQFTAGKSYEDLLVDRGLQYICIHCLELLGEAATQIDQDIRDRYPEIPWRPMIAMRHRLIHGYLDIELSFVWSTITNDIPALIPQLRALLDDER